MNQYEGMFVFPESVKDDQLDEVVGRARAEIEKAGGKIESTTRLGKRAFARILHKQEAGHYVVIGFQLDPAQLAPLIERYRLTEEILRVQVMRAEAVEAAVKKPGKDANADAVA